MGGEEVLALEVEAQQRAGLLGTRQFPRVRFGHVDEVVQVSIPYVVRGYYFTVQDVPEGAVFRGLVQGDYRAFDLAAAYSRIVSSIR